MSTWRWNFSFQHKRSELQPHIWRLNKILRHSFLAWSKVNDVNAKFVFLAISVWELVHLCVVYVFYVSSASNYIRKPSKNLTYIRNKIWPWIGDFQGLRCLQEFFCNFFHIQRVKLHRNTLSNLHEKWDKFFTLHFTLLAGLVDISTSSLVGDTTWDIQWFRV